MLDRYYNRFDPAKQDEAVLFRDGYVIQGAELNELQSIAQHRLKGIADVLFKDGDLIRDAQIAVDARTGQVRCEAGAVYLNGHWLIAHRRVRMDWEAEASLFKPAIARSTGMRGVA